MPWKRLPHYGSLVRVIRWSHTCMGSHHKGPVIQSVYDFFVFTLNKHPFMGRKQMLLPEHSRQITYSFYQQKYLYRQSQCFKTWARRYPTSVAQMIKNSASIRRLGVRVPPDRDRHIRSWSRNKQMLLHAILKRCSRYTKLTDQLIWDRRSEETNIFVSNV